MGIEEKKDLHMKQAAEYIKYFREAEERIYDKDVREQMELLIRRLQDLRDLQYWFDSGEKELDRFYDRYLPMLNMVLENYIKLETSWNHNELKKVREKLTKTMVEFMDTMNVIMEILPQDEMSDSKAEQKAKQAKEDLDRRTGRF